MNLNLLIISRTAEAAAAPSEEAPPVVDEFKQSEEEGLAGYYPGAGLWSGLSSLQSTGEIADLTASFCNTKRTTRKLFVLIFCKKAMFTEDAQSPHLPRHRTAIHWYRADREG